MSARDQFFQYLGIAGGSLLGLFALQGLVASYLDISYHAEIAELGSHEVVDKARADENARLSGIGEAMGKLAKGRSADALIVPRASDDVSAMSGWVHHPDFAIYEPAAPAAPAAPEVAPVVVAPAPAEPAAPAAPAPPAAPAVKKAVPTTTTTTPKPPAAVKAPKAAAPAAPAPAAAPAPVKPTQEHAQ